MIKIGDNKIPEEELKKLREKVQKLKRETEGKLPKRLKDIKMAKFKYNNYKLMEPFQMESVKRITGEQDNDE